MVAADIDGETAQNTAAWCIAKGWNVRALRVDVTRREDIRSMIAAALGWFGRLDILVNHAGRGSFLSLTETDDAHWDEMIALNLTAAFLASREAVRHMVASGTGAWCSTRSPAPGWQAGGAGSLTPRPSTAWWA